MVQDNQFLKHATPIQPFGNKWLKRDDLFMVAGASGGKARTCWLLAQGAKGLVTAGSRASPQINIVARIAHQLGIPCHAHTPTGELSFPLREAQDLGAKIFQHKAGYNSVIIERARSDAKAHGWTEIPFGMECAEAVAQTAKQVVDIPEDVGRIVVPVGSGMSLAGIVRGLAERQLNIPVLGVVVGANTRKRLSKWLPFGNRSRFELVDSKLDYHQEPKVITVHNGDGATLEVDPIYEAKCIPYLRAGDLFWIVGIRSGV